jgi:hypothetical protein
MRLGDPGWHGTPPRTAPENQPDILSFSGTPTNAGVLDTVRAIFEKFIFLHLDDRAR